MTGSACRCIRSDWSGADSCGRRRPTALWGSRRRSSRTCSTGLIGGTRFEAGVPQLRTSLAFYRGRVKVYETPLVEAAAVNIPTRDAIEFQFDVALSRLKPGTYVFVCNIPGHAHQGMVARFMVQ